MGKHRNVMVFSIVTLAIVLNCVVFILPELAWRYASHWTQANLPFEGPAIRAAAQLSPSNGALYALDSPEIFQSTRCNPHRAAALMRDKDLRVAYLATRLFARDVAVESLWEHQQKWLDTVDPLLVSMALRGVARRDRRSSRVTWRGEQATQLLALLVRWVPPGHWPEVRLSHQLAEDAARLAWGETWHHQLLDHVGEGDYSPWVPFAIAACADSPEAALSWAQRYPQASRAAAQDLAALWLGSWRCPASEVSLAYCALGMDRLPVQTSVEELAVTIRDGGDHLLFYWGAMQGRLRLPQPRIAVSYRTQIAVAALLSQWLGTPR
jgi:hypothetical protein